MTNFAAWATRHDIPADGIGPGGLLRGGDSRSSGTALRATLVFTAILFGGLAWLENSGGVDA